MGNLCSMPPTELMQSRELAIVSDQLSTRNFEVLKVIGKGSLGKVLQVIKKDDGQVFAMKVVSKRKLTDLKKRRHAQSERDVLAQVKSEFVVKLHCAFQTADKLFLVLDFMQGGDLHYRLRLRKQFGLATIRFYTAEILLALEDLHSNGIIYRDLKLENVLIGADGHIKLADFNLAKNLSRQKLPTRTVCGTPEYIAPEVLLGKKQTQRVDYWTLGVLMYEMLEGHTPFRASSHSQVFQKITACEYSFSPAVPEDARDCVARLLKVHAWERPESCEEIKTFAFFRGVDWTLARARALQPPIVPRVLSPLDASNFCAEEQGLSPERLGRCENSQFDDFSYEASPCRQLVRMK